MLSLKEISFSYDKQTMVLDNFNIQVNEGEVIAIKGPSGCGKSTILRLIAGLEPIQKGGITLDGKDITKIPTNKREIGFVFQSLALFPHLSVRKNIEFGLQSVTKKEKNQLVNDIAQKVDITEILERYPHQISGGQKQRVAIARSLIVKPKVLLLDEPFTALDEDLKEHVRKDIKRILDLFNITTVLVTHDKTDAIALGANIINLGK